MGQHALGVLLIKLADHALMPGSGAEIANIIISNVGAHSGSPKKKKVLYFREMWPLRKILGISIDLHNLLSTPV